MEEKDIKIIEDFNYNFLTATRLKIDMPITMYITDDINNAIMKLYEKYKQDEKMIEEMAEYISNRCFYKDDYGNNCEVIQDSCYEDKECKQCIIDYFRKKCE